MAKGLGQFDPSLIQPNNRVRLRYCGAAPDEVAPSDAFGVVVSRSASLTRVRRDGAKPVKAKQSSDEFWRDEQFNSVTGYRLDSVWRIVTGEPV